MPIIVHFRYSYRYKYREKEEKNDYRKRREAARALQGSKSLFMPIDRPWTADSADSGKSSWKKSPSHDRKY